MKRFDTSAAAALYNNRFDEHGRDIKTVGWGSARDQRLRFEVLLRGLNPTGKTILDVGCGLGDLIPYLEERTDGDFHHIGINIARKLVDDGMKTYVNARREFHTGDLFSASIPQVDISVLSGALSLKSDWILQYAQDTMNKMFDLSRETACLNFLTNCVDYELAKTSTTGRRRFSAGLSGFPEE